MTPFLRNRLLSSLLFACVMAALALALQQRPSPKRVPAPRPLPQLLLGTTVVLDPGHGGADSGVVRHGVSEAALAYRTALEVAHELRAQGANVVYTVQSEALSPELYRAGSRLVRPKDAMLLGTTLHLGVRAHDSPRLLWARADVARKVWRTQKASDPHAARNVFFLSLHYDAEGGSSHGGVVCYDRRAGRSHFSRALAAAWKVRRWGIGHCLCPRELGVLNPAFNPIPQKALLEVAMLSYAPDRTRALRCAWRRQVASEIARVLVACRHSS